MITIVKKEVGKSPYVSKVEETLEAKQKIVGGWLECVRITDDIDMWLNEEGLLIQLPLNLQTFVENEVVHHIVGDVFFASHDNEGNTVSLNETQIKWLLKRLVHIGYTVKDGEMTAVHGLIVR